MSVEQKTLIFKALGDKSRLEILSKCQNTSKCSSELKEALNLNKSTLAYHLDILVKARLLKVNYLQKEKYYFVNRETVAITKMFLDDYLNSNLKKQDLQ